MPVSTLIPPVAGTDGLPLGAEGKPVEKTAEAISGGPGFGLMPIAGTIQLLSRQSDDAQRRYGDRVFDVMMRDPIAGGSVDVLKHATLANEVRIVPRVRPRPGRPPDDPVLAERAAAAAELCQWSLDRLDTPIAQTLFECLDALSYGSSLAELVWEVVPNGRWAGKLVPKAIKPKSRTAWMFAVDAYYNTKGIVASTPTLGGWEVLPREKFFVMTWGGRGGDPRGTSILSRAAEAWNFRVQLPREHFRFCQRHGSPVPVGTLPPEESFSTTAGVETTPEQHMLNQLIGYRNGQAMVVPNGAGVILSEPKSKGEVFAMALDIYRREIILAILLQARVTMEAANGSKADSETSENLLGNLVRYARRWVARAVEWDVLYKIILYNEGRDAADEITPQIDSGQVEHQDLASLLTSLASVGYTLDASQMPEIDAAAGMPIREAPAETGAVVEEVPPETPAEDPAATGQDNGATKP